MLTVMIAAAIGLDQAGGLDSVAYQPERAGVWVDTGQFRVRVVSVRWVPAGEQQGQRGSHLVRIVTDIENVSDQPGWPSGANVLRYRMGSETEYADAATVIADPNDRARIMPGLTRRVTLSGLVPAARRSAPPDDVDVVLLQTAATYGEVPGDYLLGYQRRWEPTGRIVATVRVRVRS